MSHPMRVRGLKQGDKKIKEVQGIVAPHAGAWIETTTPSLPPCTARSHPMRVRGLKPEIIIDVIKDVGSHPMRVRGLKQTPSELQSWIECRTPCGCVD